MLGKNDRGFGGGKRQQPPLEVYRMAVLASLSIFYVSGQTWGTHPKSAHFLRKREGFVSIRLA